MLNAIRRELRKLTDILVEPSVIAEVLRAEIIKREVMEGDEAIHFERRVTKGNRKLKEETAQGAATQADDVKPSSPDLGSANVS